MAEIGIDTTIAELLLTERFLWRAIGLSDSELRDLITDLCRETRLGVVVIHAETSGSKRGSHRMVWQSFSAIILRISGSQSPLLETGLGEPTNYRGRIDNASAEAPRFI